MLVRMIWWGWIIGALIALVVLSSQGVALARRDHVADGDTFVMDGVRVRIWGIDAPELNETHGRASKAALERLIAGRRPICRKVDQDRYGRTVARCTVGGRDLGRQLVREGWARDYGRYSGGVYADAERQARAARRGMWAG